MKYLLNLIAVHPSYKKLLRAAGECRELALSGLRGSAISVIAAALRKDLERPVLIITSSTERAEWLLDDLETFGVAPILEFPVADVFSSEGGTIVDEDAHLRVATLCSLGDKSGEDPVGVIPVQAVLQPVPAPETVKNAALRIGVGDVRERDSLAADLVDAGLENVPMVEVPGEFSVRGSVLDVFAFSAANPLRVEFMGDSVESIRVFDASTQESIRRLKGAVINTAHSGRRDDSIVLDHFPGSTIVLLDEPVVLQQSSEHFIRNVKKRYLFSFSDIVRACSRFTRIDLTPLPEREVEGIFEMRCHRMSSVTPELELVAAQLAEAAKDYKKCIVLCDTDSEVDRFKELFEDRGLPRKIRLKAGRLQHGFAMPEIGLCVFTSHEIFNRYRRPRRLSAPKETAAIDELTGIDAGDYVVHITYGIGRFEGLKILESDDGSSEFLVLRYADEAKVYVPVSQMLLVQKYVGGGKRRPKLSKIRGTEWTRRKEAAGLAARGLAARLLRTHAVRAAKKRKPYPVDDEWQREFEAAFRFTETEDQLKVLGEIKLDMRRSIPLDRLVCGDVGYGKTELAMRVAFKAVTSGRQVAVLVPTTILAQQHFRTFTERMAAYPVRIGELSRFRTDSEQKAIIESLADGTTDIIIGTHRLLQKDIVFKKLGMVIIDEEQRFGVEQKEFLKRLRDTVDVLTLTATPIPRTLHMSLLGLMDVSALKTPPQDRLAIETKVVSFSEEIIRDGILREMNRNGQVYFIHNRVYNIKALADRIGKIVPEARIAVGHGQMAARELEAAMTSFLNGKIDVLVSTTIVESGLDIPSVNTIFINRADDFGLADLHQLRGRVGRYKHRAYAYFILPERRCLTPVAARRLKAIEDFAYLGAGFDIAMRDLEVRGAGNILGREQHGHIAAVGYGLYCKLLERAVGECGGEDAEPLEWVDIRIGLASFIPNEYVSHIPQRLDLYRRFACARDEGEIKNILVRIRDRFGPLPKQVETLAAESRIRISLSRMDVLSAQRVGDFLEIILRESRSETVNSLTPLGFIRTKPNKLALKVGDRNPEDLLKTLGRLV